MTSLYYPMDVQSAPLLGRYPANDAFAPSKRGRSALQINLDVRRTLRAATLGR